LRVRSGLCPSSKSSLPSPPARVSSPAPPLRLSLLWSPAKTSLRIFTSYLIAFHPHKLKLRMIADFWGLEFGAAEGGEIFWRWGGTPPPRMGHGNRALGCRLRSLRSQILSKGFRGSPGGVAYANGQCSGPLPTARADLARQCPLGGLGRTLEGDRNNRPPSATIPQD
jgi:hypothetical protein